MEKEQKKQVWIYESDYERLKNNFGKPGESVAEWVRRTVSGRPIQHQVLDLQYELDMLEGLLDMLETHLKEEANKHNTNNELQIAEALEASLDYLRKIRGET